MSKDFFGDKDYKIPSSGGNYLNKFPEGATKFRALTSAIVGWEDWIDGKPVRYAMDSKPPFPSSADSPIRHFWAMVIWNYEEKAIQILEIAQKTIQGAIKDLVDNESWGDPQTFDISITRKGSTMADTEYTVMPNPKTEITAEIKEAFKDKPVNLKALFTGDDPFKKDE